MCWNVSSKTNIVLKHVQHLLSAWVYLQNHRFRLHSKHPHVTLMSHLLLSRIYHWSTYQSDVTKLLQIAEDTQKQLFTIKKTEQIYNIACSISNYAIVSNFKAVKTKTIVLYSTQCIVLPVECLTIRDQAFCFVFKSCWLWK